MQLVELQFEACPAVRHTIQMQDLLVQSLVCLLRIQSTLARRERGGGAGRGRGKRAREGWGWGS